MTGAAVARAAHDVGAAALLGGNLFGRIALNPALANVSAERERGRVLNVAWRRYATVNSLSLAAVVAGWARGRRGDGALGRARDAAVVAVAATGLASAAGGVRLNRSAPEGAVPLRDGGRPAADTPPGAARTKRIVNTLGAANAAAELALVTLNAIDR